MLLPGHRRPPCREEPRSRAFSSPTDRHGSPRASEGCGVTRGSRTAGASGPGRLPSGRPGPLAVRHLGGLSRPQRSQTRPHRGLQPHRRPGKSLNARTRGFVPPDSSAQRPQLPGSLRARPWGARQAWYTAAPTGDGASLPHSPPSRPNRQQNKQPHKRGGCPSRSGSAGPAHGPRGAISVY